MMSCIEQLKQKEEEFKEIVNKWQNLFDSTYKIGMVWKDRAIRAETELMELKRK